MIPNDPKNEVRFCHELLRLGRWHAAQRGLHAEEGEDCAMDFALHVLTLLRASACEDTLAVRTGTHHLAWLHRRARTHARNFHRALHNHSRRNLFFLTSGIAQTGEEPISQEDGGDATLLRAEFWCHIFAALNGLDLIPRQMLIGHHLQAESIETLAASCGRNCHAVEQTLLRARRQMRQVLERRGCSETVLREYVAAFAPDHALYETFSA